MECPQLSIQKSEKKHEEMKKASSWKTFSQKRSNSDSSAINETANSISVAPFNLMDLSWSGRARSRQWFMVKLESAKCCSANSCHGVSLCWTWMRRPYPIIHQNRIVVCKILEKRAWRNLETSRRVQRSANIETSNVPGHQTLKTNREDLVTINRPPTESVSQSQSYHSTPSDISE